MQHKNQGTLKKKIFPRDVYVVKFRLSQKHEWKFSICSHAHKCNGNFVILNQYLNVAQMIWPSRSGFITRRGTVHTSQFVRNKRYWYWQFTESPWTFRLITVFCGT